MEKCIKFIKGILFSILLFVLYIFVCPLVFSYLLQKPAQSENFWISNLSYLGVYALTFLVILLIVHKDVFRQFKEFIHEPKKYLNKGLSYWVYGLIVMMISNLIVSSLVGNIAVNEQETRQILLSAPLYAIPTIIFFGPFLEELIFRYGLRKAFDKKIVYALFSGLIFGGLHVTTAIDEFTIASIMSHISEFLFIIPYGSLGFFFAKAYYETDNIFSSAVPHMLHNTISVLLILAMHFIGV